MTTEHFPRLNFRALRSSLPAPTAVEDVSYADILASLNEGLQALEPAYSADVTDPIYHVHEGVAYNEYVLRQYINQRFLAMLPQYAVGNDLRLHAEGAGIIVADTDTDDDIYRKIAADAKSAPSRSDTYRMGRIESLSPSITSVGFVTESTGRDTTHIYVLTNETESGLASDGINALVTAEVNDPDFSCDVRDRYFVLIPTLTAYQVDAVIYYRAADATEQDVLKRATDSITAYTRRRHRLGRDVRLDGITAALQVEDVEYSDITSPRTDLIAADQSIAYYADSIKITPSPIR